MSKYADFVEDITFNQYTTKIIPVSVTCFYAFGDEFSNFIV